MKKAKYSGDFSMVYTRQLNTVQCTYDAFSYPPKFTPLTQAYRNWRPASALSKHLNPTPRVKEGATVLLPLLWQMLTDS